MPALLQLQIQSADTVSLEDLEVMDVATPSIAAVSTLQITSDVELLRPEVTRLKDIS